MLALTSALKNGHDVALEVGDLGGRTSDVEVLGESREDEDTATETWSRISWVPQSSWPRGGQKSWKQDPPVSYPKRKMPMKPTAAQR